ncbi:MAG: folate-binding protein [Pseudomonadota bacterium]
MSQRRILRVSGADAAAFLQNLVTNDVDAVANGLVYAALLTPQGKFLVDFFMLSDADGILLDVAEDFADGLQQRLAMYKLRAAVEIAAVDLFVHRGVGDAPADGFADPRSAAMGWRAYRTQPPGPDVVDWTALRVREAIPETGVELTPDTFILEAGFERLNGVDFRKGCYVGQEIVARMKHKTTLRKGLVTVEVAGAAPVGTAITANGKAAGILLSQAGDQAIAYLRFDRITETMTAGDATVSMPAVQEIG